MKYFKVFLVFVLGCSVHFSYCQTGIQKVTEIKIDCTNCYLFLNGSDYNLLDNALRCFKLTSIGHSYDSLIRYWYLFPPERKDSIWSATLKMIELGKSAGKKVARVYTLVWNAPSNDSLLKVSSIQVLDLIPKSGWYIFDKQILSAGLHKFIDLDFPKDVQLNGGTYGLSILQCFQWPIVKTYDFFVFGDSKIDFVHRKLVELKLIIIEEFNGLFFPPISDEMIKTLKADFLNQH